MTTPEAEHPRKPEQRATARTHQRRGPLLPFRPPGPERERGSAVVDFVLVSGLLTVLFLGVLQLTLMLHVRNSLIDAASSGARYGALADRVPDDAVVRARDLISGAVGPGFAQDITAIETQDGDDRLITVTIRAPFPVVGLLGPDRALEVNGRAERVG